MSRDPQQPAAGDAGPRGNFDAAVNVRRTSDTHPHMRATLTRAADGKAFTAALWLTVEERPHPETGEIVRTRVLSGPLQPTGLKDALDGMGAAREKGTPGRLGTNRIKLIENLSAAAAAMLDGQPNAHRQATFYGLANMDGITERVAGWEVNKIGTLPGKLLGNTQPFTPRADAAEEVVVEEVRPAPRRRATTAPRTGQGTA